MSFYFLASLDQGKDFFMNLVNWVVMMSSKEVKYISFCSLR